jgi:hypothetical protein
MIFWRIRFDESNPQPDTEFGYLVLDADLNAIGVYDDNGVKHNGGVQYTTIDQGEGPMIGVTPPVWADSIV